MLVLVAVSAVGLLALAGCGGSSGPTKAQYVAKANTICADARKQTLPLIGALKSSIASVLSGGSEKPLIRVAKRLNTTASATLTRLRAIARPDADSAKIARFLKPLSGVVADLGQLASTLGAGNTADALAALEREQATGAKVVKAAQAYGLTRCSTLLSPAK